MEVKLIKNLKLKGAIAEADLSYPQLAEKVGVTKQTIYNAVKGGNVSMELARKICVVLNRSLDDLFGGE